MTLTARKAASTAYSTRLSLAKTKTTTVHVVRYERRSARPRIVLFDKPARLLDWCQQEKVDNAMIGGFFRRDAHKPLGDLWIDGQQQPSVPFTAPWDAIRGSIHIDKFFDVQLDNRNKFASKPTGDLLQAGPLLTANGRNLLENNSDTEGFSEANNQFDSDITIGRYPRAAIGINDDYIFSVACDGRSKDDAGLTLTELADFMLSLGSESALNLDGGGSATVIHNRKLLNNPRSNIYVHSRGRKIYSAIIFETVR
jgi:hypothetical protein